MRRDLPRSESLRSCLFLKGEGISQGGGGGGGDFDGDGDGDGDGDMRFSGEILMGGGISCNDMGIRQRML